MLSQLSGYEILAGIIAPAVLISASASLILSTANRLGRIFDRVTLLKNEIDRNLEISLPFREERIAYFNSQLRIQSRRANLIQNAMASLYLATLLFISASVTMGILLWLKAGHTYIATGIVLTGGMFLFIAMALLFYESKHNLRFIRAQIEYTNFLCSKL